VLSRDLKRTVLVDNAVYSYYFQQENGIPIVPYYQGPNDYELKHLAEYLDRLSQADDIRAVNRQLLQL
jgi:CTD small phosphatase-like protein 2